MCSQQYLDMIEKARQEFVRLLEGHAPIAISEEKYEAGVDTLPDDVQVMKKRVCETIIKSEGYDLSYNQVCIAFFSAANGMKLVQVTSS